MTIDIDPELKRRMKAAAAARGCFIQEVATEAFESWLAQREAHSGSLV